MFSSGMGLCLKIEWTRFHCVPGFKANPKLALLVNANYFFRFTPTCLLVVRNIVYSYTVSPRHCWFVFFTCFRFNFWSFPQSIWRNPYLLGLKSMSSMVLHSWIPTFDGVGAKSSCFLSVQWLLPWKQNTHSYIIYLNLVPKCSKKKAELTHIFPHFPQFCPQILLVGGFNPSEKY